ncbi:MAG: TonB-dependent receptor, partial [Bryobacteraceae bacterium]|nr:TonB-dependent receptor [Bryobacteraceae bacterium]
WRTTFQKQYARYWRDRGVFGSALNPATGIMSRTFTVGDFANPGIHAQSDLAGFASTGAIRHAWVVGGDFFSRTSLYKSTVPVPYEPVNIFIPTDSRAPIPAPRSLAFYNDPQEKFGGVFLQDQLTLGRLQILGGLRINVYRRDYTNRVNGQHILTDSNTVAPRIGVSYRLTQSLMGYASWARSFVPVAGNTSAGVPFQPTRGEQVEAGLKSELLNRRLLGTFSIFSLTKSNVTAVDPLNPAFSIQVGEQRTRGIEMETRGSLTREWNVAASYALLNSRVQRDTIYPAGNLLPNTPRHGGNLWTTYDFSRGRIQGFGLSGGFYSVTARQGDLLNTFQLPGYASVDLAASYRVVRQDKLRSRLQIQVLNVLDRKYYESAGSRFGIYPGSPRALRVTMQVYF